MLANKIGNLANTSLPIEDKLDVLKMFLKENDVKGMVAIKIIRVFIDQETEKLIKGIEEEFNEK